MKDKETEEYALLTEITGVPTEEIPKALKAFDVLFPQSEGDWLMDVTNSNIKQLRMLPMPLCGIGANFRRIVYAEDKKYEKRFYIS